MVSGASSTQVTPGMTNGDEADKMEGEIECSALAKGPPSVCPSWVPAAGGKRDGGSWTPQPSQVTLLRVPSVWVTTLAFVSRAVWRIGN